MASLFEKMFGGLYVYWKKREITRQAMRLEMMNQFLKQLPDAVQRVDLGKRQEPPSIGGTTEEYEQVFGIGPWVYAAINTIAENIASIEWKLWDPVGEQDIDWSDTPVEFPKRPNPFQSWNELRQLSQIYLDTTGCGYIYRQKASESREHDLDRYWALRSSRVRVIVDEANNEILGYAYRKKGFTDSQFIKNGHRSRFWKLEPDADAIYKSQSDFDRHMLKLYEYYTEGVTPVQKLSFENNQEWIPLPKENVIAIKYPNPTNEFYGLSPLQPLMISFISEMFARKWNRDFFQNGAIPPGILTIPTKISIDEQRRLTEMFKQNHNNAETPFVPFVAAGGAEYTPILNQHTDLDFLNLLRMSRDETLSVFGVPPHMANVLEGVHDSTQSVGIREQEKRFWRATAIPKMVMIADAWNHKMSNDEGFGQGIELYFDTTKIEALKPDWQERITAGKDAITAGFTLREVREFIYDLEPEPDGLIYLPANVVPVDPKNPLTFEEMAYYNTILPQAVGNHVAIRGSASRHRRQRRQHARQKALADLSEEDADPEAERAFLWEVIDKEFDIVEDEIFIWLKRLFSEQQARVLDWVRLTFTKSIAKDPRDLIDDLPALAQNERQEFIDAALEEFEIQVEEAGQFGLENAGILGSFDVLDPNVQAFVFDKAIKFGENVTNTTIEQLRVQFREAIDEGEGIEPIAKRVRQVFHGTVRASAPRSRLIARTETTGIVNGGRHLSFKQVPDLVDKKQWLSSRDNRVRPSHTAADGQVVAMNDTFQVGGSNLMFPGDPNGAIEEIANCRCTFLAVLIPDEIPEQIPEIPSFPDEGFSTTEKIQEWAYKKYPDIEWDFEECQTEIMNDTIRQLDKHLEEWPEVRERIKYFGTYKDSQKWSGVGYGKFGNEYAHMYRSSSTEYVIAVNPDFYKDLMPESFKRRLARDHDSNTIIKGKHYSHFIKAEEEDHVAAILTHEFGHAWDFWMEDERRGWSNAAHFEGQGTLRTLWDTFRAKYNATRTTSIYATTNKREEVAEGFAASYFQRTSQMTAWTKKVKLMRETVAERLRPNLQGLADIPTFSEMSQEDKQEERELIQEIYQLFNLDPQF